MATTQEKASDLANSSTLKLLQYIATAIIVPTLWQIAGTLSQIQTQQAVTANDVSTVKTLNTARDSDLDRVHQQLGSLDARMAAMEAVSKQQR